MLPFPFLSSSFAAVRVFAGDNNREHRDGHRGAAMVRCCGRARHLRVYVGAGGFSIYRPRALGAEANIAHSVGMQSTALCMKHLGGRGSV